MLTRRTAFGLLVAPALVHAGSLMPISTLIQRLPQRFILRVRYVQGGKGTIIGQAPLADFNNLPRLAAKFADQTLWMGDFGWESMHLEVLRDTDRIDWSVGPRVTRRVDQWSPHRLA